MISLPMTKAKSLESKVNLHKEKDLPKVKPKQLKKAAKNLLEDKKSQNLQKKFPKVSKLDIKLKMRETQEKGAHQYSLKISLIQKRHQ